MTDAPVVYPHCRHCCWGNPHHPDNDPDHATPCSSGCTGQQPLSPAAVEPDALFELAP